MERTPVIAIIVLNYNGKEDTLECLKSLSRLDYPYYKVYVVDNGSKDDSISAIRLQFPDITLIENKNNLGFAEGNNIGIRYALTEGAQAFLILNNDTVVKSDLLNAFVKAHAENPQAGILGATLYRFDHPDTLDHLGGTWNPSTCNFDLIGLQTKILPFKTVTPMDYICGAGMYIPAETFRIIGLFEKDFFLLWEDADLCFRAQRAGFLVVTCPEAIIWHKGSASFSGKPHSTYFFWRSRLLWIKRNIKPSERRRLYINYLLPELFKLARRSLIKHCEYKLLHLLTRKDLTAKKKYLDRSTAALQGAKDYFLSNFGPYQTKT